MSGVAQRGARRAGTDVVVVGAGVVGAATALALAQAGWRVTLVEARAPQATDPAIRDLRVYALAPNSTAWFDRLGVWPAIRARRAQPYRAMRVWDAASPSELRFDAAMLGAAALGHIVEQQAIQDALRDALERTDGVTLHCPARVQGLDATDDGVALELDDGTRLVARLALAADGADSPLRTLAGVAVQAHDYHQRAIVAYVQTAEAHADTAWQRFLPGGPLALLPCSDGLGSIVWSLPTEDAGRLLASAAAAFEDELTRAFDARLGAMRLVSSRAGFPLRRQLAGRYVAQRVALLGDAAHVVHPLAGQGVNLGLQDAMELVATLDAARARGRDPGAGATLRRYERVRRSENAIAAHGFEALNRLFSNDALLPTLLRGPGLGLVDRIAPLKRLLARQAMGGAPR